MILGRIFVHLLSAFWLAGTYRQWRNFLLSTNLFLLFSCFIIAANLALYFYKTLDKIANVVGVGLGANLAFFISIFVLFLWVKNNHLKHKKLEDKVVRLARRLAIEDFEKEQYS